MRFLEINVIVKPEGRTPYCEIVVGTEINLRTARVMNAGGALDQLSYGATKTVSDCSLIAARVATPRGKGAEARRRRLGGDCRKTYGSALAFDLYECARE